MPQKETPNCSLVFSRTNYICNCLDSYSNKVGLFTDVALEKAKWHFVTVMPTACLSKKQMDTLANVKLDTLEMAVMEIVQITA